MTGFLIAGSAAPLRRWYEVACNPSHPWPAVVQIDYVNRKYRTLGATTARVRHTAATPQENFKLEQDVFHGFVPLAIREFATSYPVTSSR